MVIVSCSTKFHAFNLAEELERRDKLSTLYTSFSSKKNKLASHFYRRYDPQKIEVDKIRTILPIAIGIKLYRDNFFWNSLFDRFVSQSLNKVADQFDVFIGWSGMSLRSIAVAKKLGKVAIVERGSTHIEYQSMNLSEEYARLGIEYKIDERVVEREKLEYSQADYISIPSTFVENSFIEMGIPKNKLLVNPYGVNSHFHKVPVKRPKSFRILYVGRLCVRKGLVYLFQALKELNDAKYDYEVEFLGSIDDDFQTIVHEWKTKFPNWNFAGHVPHEELPAHFSSCDVAIQPSLLEGLSLVIAQLISCGVPVIATRNTGAENIIRHGENGFVIEARSSHEICKRIVQLYENPSLLERMKSLAIQSSSVLTWRSYGDRWERNLAEILKA